MLKKIREHQVSLTTTLFCVILSILTSLFWFLEGSLFFKLGASMLTFGLEFSALFHDYLTHKKEG